MDGPKSSLMMVGVYDRGKIKAIALGKWLMNSNKIVVRLGSNGSKSQENTVTTFMDSPLIKLKFCEKDTKFL